jgi:YHS domain-containing protein
MNPASLTRSKVLPGTLLALAFMTIGTLRAAEGDRMEGPQIGLGGYCPVCILDANKWAKGSPDHQATYDGVTYYFPEEDIKAKFLANPAKYVPALGGDCIVCYAKLGKRVPGSVNHAARYDNRLFLFPGTEQQQAFLNNPSEFANVDLALNGDCAVCQVNANKRVAGKPEFTEVKDGFRYQFVSEREQSAFRQDPAHYVDPASKPTAMESPTSQRPKGNDARGSMQMVKADHMEQPRIGLGGYCPVCILDANKWAKGSPEYQATYDGVTYHFPEEAIKQNFLAHPAKYVPALGGDCIVCYAKLGKRVPGSINHAARYDNRLYLFPGAEQQQAFLNNPTEFANVDLALNGDCAVCQVHHNKRVAGKPEFTEIKDGFRYQFVSEREQSAFRQDPAAYVPPASNRTSMMESPQSQQPAENRSLTVTGKTACAGCEHGVKTIQNPEELGLAVDTDDGKVVIVEQAHKLYRDAYENRFDAQRVRVSGRVLKEQGRFTWIEPTELMVQK